MSPTSNQEIEPGLIQAESGKKRGGQRGMWLLIGIAVLLITILAAIAYEANTVVTNSDFCVNCHEMRPEYFTWEASSHTKVPCTACHLPVDQRQRFVRNLQGIRLVFKHYLGNYQLPIVVWQPVSKENCLVCHSQNRKASPSGDIKVSHVNHDNRGISCVNCHSGVVHGRIVERNKTEKVKPEDWSQKVAQSEVQSSDTKPNMLQCLTCHREWKVSTQCEKCHSKIPTPPSHQPATWQVMHGKEAWDDVNRCSQCHYEKGLDDKFDKQRVADYIRSNSFCVGCHLKAKPSSHTQNWPHDHAAQVVRGQVPYCIVCHDVNKSQGNSSIKGTFTYCNKCHGVLTVWDRLVQRINN